MKYRLLDSTKAAHQLEQLPQEFLIELEESLEFLSFAPTFYSLPIASPPFPPRGQLFHFTAMSANGKRWFFTVIF